MEMVIENRIKHRDFHQRVRWCIEIFGECPKVNSYIQAELYRCCYETAGFQIIYFKDYGDYLLYLLKFP